MTSKEIIGALNDIEENVEVSKIEYKGIKIWPLLRLEIWKVLQQGVPPLTKVKSSFSSSLKEYYKKFKKRISLYSEHIFYKFKNRWQKVPAVFLVAPLERRVKIDGKYYSQFSNSVQELLEELDIPFLTLDLARKHLPVYGETNFIDSEMLLQSKINKIKKIFWKEEGLNEYWEKLKNYLATKYPEVKIPKKNIEYLAQMIVDYEKVFERILKKTEPKVAFLVCYYHPTAMGYVRAARKLGIKTIEIQHGQQDLHAMYTNWTNLPRKGYDTLPSQWFSWGENAAKDINNWAKKVFPEHQAIVVGNPWIAKSINAIGEGDSADMGKLNPILENRINVVVGIQPFHPFLSEELLKAISHAPPNINWLVRPHPVVLNNHDNMKEIREQFKKTKNENIEIEYSMMAPFFSLLKKADFIITSWSSIAYEALLFNVHPIIIHPNGADLFKEYINKKLFTYAPSSQQILDTIMSDKSNFNFKEEHPHMETDRQKMKKILLDLIEK